MKKTLSFGILLAVVLTWAVGQEATTTVQVAPSDQVIYPDASQILNKTEPKPAKPLPPAPLASAHPLLGTTPVLAKPSPAKPASPKPVATPAAAGGWYLRWTVTGDEAGARSWATTRGADQVAPLGPDLWEVLAGPLTSEGFQKALEGQAGQAQLVKR